MIITRSPLRISLGGGGTDLPSYYAKHSGFLIAAAIDKYVYITVHQTFQFDPVRQFEALARASEDHGMFPDGVPGADGVHADLVRRSLPGHPLASVHHIRVAIQAAGVAQGLREVFRGSARRVFLKAVVRFDNFDIEALAKRLGGAAGEGEKRVYADRKVRGLQHRD